MDFKLSPEHLTEALARANQHWHTQAGADRPRPFCIAISREAGTYGAAIARTIGNRLGWPVYDSELLQRIASEMGVRQKLVESVDERQQGWFSECVNAVFSVPAVSQTKYLRYLVETLLSLAAHGDCVIVGRGATNVLPADTTLRVRVVAPREHRIDAVRREHGISAKEAADRVDTTDRERNQFVMNHFQIDPTNTANYDLVLNAARFTTEQCADLILAALEDLRSRQAPDVAASGLEAMAAP